jgi:hypothetical protein
MILYGSPLSPFVRKTLAFAAEKGLELELVQAGMGGGPPEFKLASPFGKMPGFKDGDFLISDSTAIITYLEALHPEPNLIPAEPRARARTIWYEEFADTILIAAAGPMFFNRLVAPKFLGRPGDDAAADHAEKSLLPPVLAHHTDVGLPGGGPHHPGRPGRGHGLRESGPYRLPGGSRDLSPHRGLCGGDPRPPILRPLGGPGKGDAGRLRPAPLAAWPPAP